MEWRQLLKTTWTKFDWGIKAEQYKRKKFVNEGTSESKLTWKIDRDKMKKKLSILDRFKIKNRKKSVKKIKSNALNL